MKSLHMFPIGIIEPHLFAAVMIGGATTHDNLTDSTRVICGYMSTYLLGSTCDGTFTFTTKVCTGVQLARC